MAGRVSWLVLALAAAAGLSAVVATPSVAPARPAAPAPRPDLAALGTDQLMAAGLAAFQANDFPLAQAYFRHLAQRGNPAAETLLGTMAARGQGAAADPAVAAAWFLRAARRGYAPAQYALADAFARGQGVPQNSARARELARAAAQQGQPGAAQLATRLGPERMALLAGGRP